ncbi:MAG: DUF2255 family protein [Anaerolineae bacterium]|nr:DUF2255 family protein [Anaerolineae bacterium]
MTNWTTDELNKIEHTEELRIASQRLDGTLRKQTIIWVVRVDNDLYVRSVYGRKSDWFRGMQSQHTGRIQAGGIEKDVRFEEIPADDGINDLVDAEYRTKYRHYAASIIDSVTSLTARLATIKLIPR